MQNIGSKNKENEQINLHEPDMEKEQGKGIEQKEREEVVIKVNTMKDFMDSLKWSYDLAEDSETKEKILHQIIKIRHGLNIAGVSADSVYIKETPNGVLGMYDTNSKKVIIDSDLVEDFNSSQKLITHVIFHEMTHSKGYVDEGITEMKVNKSIPAMMKFYVSEQQRAERTFNKLGSEKTLSLYDIDQPEKLVRGYLKVELKNYYKGSKLEDLKEKKFEKTVSKEAEKHSGALRESVPELADKLSSESLKGEIRKILEKLNKKNKN